MIGDAAQLRGIARRVGAIRPALAGLPPEVQGAILAELLAIWLAGHHVEGDEDATRKMRAELLAEHCTAVRQLTEVNARILGTTPSAIVNTGKHCPHGLEPRSS